MKFLHNTGRIEAFSDAVFAFAATLMVFNIDTQASFNYLVENNWQSLLGFGMSFFVLILLWVVHYNFFRRTAHMDNWIITLNSIFLFLILYYCFPLKSLINSMLGQESINLDGLGSLFTMYSLGFVAIFLCLSLMYSRAYQKTKTIGGSLKLLFYARHFAIYVAVALVSMFLAIYRIGIEFALPGIIYAILGPLCFWHGIHFNKVYKNAFE